MRGLLISVCCSLPVSAYAIAATQEQILCHSGQIVVADVISGKSADCRLQYRDCYPRDLGTLQVRIIDVLAVGDDAAFRRFGAAMTDNKFAEAPHEVRTTPVIKNQTVEVSARMSEPLEAPLTDVQVNERFRGKRLLLSLSFGGGVLPLLENSIDDSGTKKGPPTSLPSGSDLYAQIWPAERREWVEKTIVDQNGKNCPKAAIIDGRGPQSVNGHLHIADRRGLRRGAPFVPEVIQVPVGAALAGRWGSDEEGEVAYAPRPDLGHLCLSQRHHVRLVA